MLGHMPYLLGYKVGASPFPKHLQESGCRGKPKSCIQIIYGPFPEILVDIAYL